MDVPNEPIGFVPAVAGEILKLGLITIRIIEDGSTTDNRIGVAEFTVPGGIPGPVAHWHEMHDEIFFVKKGKLRFHGRDGKIIDANTGDYVVVPPRAPHTFSNPFEEEAIFINTYTPSFYINYFKLLAQISEPGKPMTKEANQRAMAYFATIGVADEYMKAPEEKSTS